MSATVVTRPTRSRLSAPRALLGLCVVLTILIALVASDALGATLAPPVSVGMNLGGSATRALEDATKAVQDATFAAMRNSGITRLRVDIAFDTTERRSGVFTWHQSAYVREAVANHLRVDALLDYPPKWAIMKNGSASPQLFAVFAGAAALHFKPLGVHMYELLNEPNRRRAGGARVDAVAYAQLLRLSYPRIKKADAGATVLVGGLATSADRPNNAGLSMSTFLTSIYSHGARGFFNGIAVHPDSAPVLPMHPAAWNPFYSLPKLRQIMVAHGDGKKKLWLTEYGAPTSGPHSVTYSAQAAAVSQAYAQTLRWGWVAAIFYFNWQDNPFDGPWGISTSSGRPKPALNALRIMLKRPTSNAVIPRIPRG